MTTTAKWRNFERLGRAIADRLAGRDHLDLRFAEISESVLCEFAGLVAPDFDEIIEFVGATQVRQEPNNQFSNLPLVVYRDRDFFIELLVWCGATTEIHQHSFTGAFRVLGGSSLHVAYDYTPETCTDRRIRFGTLGLESVELLTIGDVRRITPGDDGLIHSLFHLESPSMTLVVRTYSVPWLQPQYVYLRSGVGLAAFELASDPVVAMLRRALTAAAGAEAARMNMRVIELAHGLDLPRAAALLMDFFPALDLNGREQVRAALCAKWGSLAHKLIDGLEDLAHRNRVAISRPFVHDPDARFLLALLSNVPSWAQMAPLVGLRQQDIDSRRCVALALARLTMKSQGVGFEMAAPSAFLTALLWCDDSQLSLHARAELIVAMLGAQGSTGATRDRHAFASSLCAIPELQPLWRR